MITLTMTATNEEIQNATNKGLVVEFVIDECDLDFDLDSI